LACSAGEADILRRAMGKKKRAELERQKEKFVTGAIKNNIKKDVANYVFTKIEPFADYGFNKSHAVAYALIAFQTAYLKTYYKEEFIAASMSTSLTNTGKLREYVEELKRLKVHVIRPSINNCFAEFKADTNKIFYGLGAIKSVGFEAVSNIVTEREKNGKFNTFTDFINRVDPKDINKLQLEGLVKAGAFDEIDLNRKKLYDDIPKIIQTIKSKYDEKVSNQTNLFDEINNKDNETFKFSSTKSWTKKELLAEEFASLGFYISDHPLNEYKEFFTQLEINSYKDFINSNKPESLVAGTIMSVQEKKSAKGNSYAIIKFSDNKSEFEIFLFADLFASNRDKLIESNSFILTLHKDRNVGENNLTRVNIRKIVDLSDLVNKTYQSVSIELNNREKLKELNELLKNNGDTTINVILRESNKNYSFELEKTRKFNFDLFSLIKNKEYVNKISF
jgi:DNA polymerase-3 subunit alpha